MSAEANDPKPDSPDAPEAPKPSAWRILDRFDPLTWETPEHITPLMRWGAALVLVVVFVMTFLVPLRIIGWL